MKRIETKKGEINDYFQAKQWSIKNKFSMQNLNYN